MTTQEFLDFASNQPLYDLYNGSNTKEELRKDFHKYYTSGNAPEKIIDFFCAVGWLAFERKEKNSDDILTIDLRYMVHNFFWNDIGCAVNAVGFINGFAGQIEKLYISEQGKFYNQNHKLIAETKEDFFDYLVAVEFDFHPKIRQRTYDMLKHVGWFKGRCVDTVEFDLKMKQRGIMLTKEQLCFLSEFSGLKFIFDDDSWRFYSLENIQNEYRPFKVNTKLRNINIFGKHIFECGCTMGGGIYLCDNGLLSDGSNMLGRTKMECVNHLCNWVSKDSKWLYDDE